MPPQLLFPMEQLDPNKLWASMDVVRKFNQQRFEMEQIDGILHFDTAAALAVGVKNCRPDEFWVRGHVPGRPLLPGVLMCECAAQVCSFLYANQAETAGRFLGFGGMEGVKFRGQVVPGDRLIMMAKGIDMRPRRSIFQTQGVVNGKLVFEGQIIGMPM